MRSLFRAALAASLVLASAGAQAACQDPPGVVAERECMARALETTAR